MNSVSPGPAQRFLPHPMSTMPLGGWCLYWPNQTHNPIFASANLPKRGQDLVTRWYKKNWMLAMAGRSKGDITREQSGDVWRFVAAEDGHRAHLGTQTVGQTAPNSHNIHNECHHLLTILTPGFADRLIQLCTSVMLHLLLSAYLSGHYPCILYWGTYWMSLLQAHSLFPYRYISVSPLTKYLFPIRFFFLCPHLP